MKGFVLLLTCLFLLSCSSINDVLHHTECFDTESDAQRIGDELFQRGFNSKVSYWLTGDSNNRIPGLGLQYGGFDPKPYCPSGGYPILVYFDSSKSHLDIDSVQRWSKVVLDSMLRERTRN